MNKGNIVTIVVWIVGEVDIEKMKSYVANVFLWMLDFTSPDPFLDIFWGA